MKICTKKLLSNWFIKGTLTSFFGFNDLWWYCAFEIGVGKSYPEV